MPRHGLTLLAPPLQVVIGCWIPSVALGSGLSSDALHRVAWPVARQCFADKYADQIRRVRETGIQPLAVDAYERPTSITRSSAGWIVFYGGAPAGPSISVRVDEAGRVIGCTADLAIK